MGLLDDLTERVEDILGTYWDIKNGRKVPRRENIRLRANSASIIQAAVLYADLADSTELVDAYPPEFSAEVYRCYLHCCGRFIGHQGGEITSYDGDRVMAVYQGEDKEERAVITAWAINYSVNQIINPAIKRYYLTSYQVRQAVGIDTSDILVARIGIQGRNDLVWIGRAANYAAKLCARRQGSFGTWITDDVYKALSPEFRAYHGRHLWWRQQWSDRKIGIYGSRQEIALN